ncbi:hypothetical protein ACFSMW_18245 [Virgibacillus halophilus]|uniref:hypothetical protein n=1 Tax=Tigheibacillus halophilus TaxID=361280 RepID=UPI003634A5EA
MPKKYYQECYEVNSSILPQIILASQRVAIALKALLKRMAILSCKTVGYSRTSSICICISSHVL